MPHDTRAPVRGAAQSSNDRLERWYRDHLTALYGYCRARLGAQDAEDVTSEVFGAAAEQLRRDPDVSLSRSWFLTTAHNRIIDRWRREERWRRRMPAMVQAATATANDPAGEVDVIAALDQLPDHQRAVLVLFYVEGHSAKEIAELLGRTPSAIDSLLARGRRGLLRLVDETREEKA